jgi:general secretion pathway protein G
MQQSRRNRRPRLEGMTLIEIMIVVVIMAMMAAAVGIGVMSAKKESDKRIAESDVQNLAHVVEAYLLTKVGAACPGIPQLEESHVLRKGSNTEDPWGTSYRIACEEDEVLVRSAGPDKQHETEDDITTAR